jgi:hypothetical protein
VKVASLIDDENIALQCLSYLRSVKPDKRTPVEFKKYVETVLLPTITGATKCTISVKTIGGWMVKMGFNRTKVSNGIYYDGYEREDVVEYRKLFTSRFQEYEKLMSTI